MSGVKNMKSPTRRNGPGLTYYLHDESAAFRFELAGDLSEDGVPDLDQARQTASSVLGGRLLIVDVTGIHSIDAAGSELLDKWYGPGAQLVVTTAEAKSRIQPLTNAPITFLGTNPKAGRWLRARAGTGKSQKGHFDDFSNYSVPGT